MRLSDEEVLYPVEGTLAPVFRSRVDDLFLLGLDREAREARHGDFADIIREARVNALVASPLYGGIVDAELAAKRGTPVADSGRLIAHEEQVLTELKTLYGVDGAERLIGKTVAFLAAHPRLKQLFDTPGLGAQDAGRTAMEALIEHVRKL